jgi:hypothetical protein
MADQCALWFVTWGSAQVEVFDSEEDAAHRAAHLADSGNSSILGAQFPDGRTIRAEDWHAFDEAFDALMAAPASTEPPRPTREIGDPFLKGRTVAVDVDMPGWVGR